jgi:hypothetical protein
MHASDRKMVGSRQEKRLMINRTVLGAILALLMVAAGAASQSRAQQQSVAQAIAPAGWVFNIAPYLWLPTADMSLQYNLPPALRTAYSRDRSDTHLQKKPLTRDRIRELDKFRP